MAYVEKLEFEVEGLTATIRLLHDLAHRERWDLVQGLLCVSVHRIEGEDIPIGVAEALQAEIDGLFTTN